MAGTNESHLTERQQYWLKHNRLTEELRLGLAICKRH